MGAVNQERTRFGLLLHQAGLFGAPSQSGLQLTHFLKNFTQARQKPSCYHVNLPSNGFC